MSTTASSAPSAADSRDVRRYVRMIGAALDRRLSEVERLESRIELGLEVAAHLRDVSRPVLPEPWPHWPRGDRGLAQRLEALAGARPESREHEEAQAIADYRAARWRAEQEGVSRLLVLLDALDALATKVKAGKTNGCRDAAIEQAAKDCYVFACAEWRIPHPFEVFLPPAERRELVDRTISKWVRR